MQFKYIYPLVLVCLIISHSSKAQDYQLSTTSGTHNDSATAFLKSVFQDGITHYLKHTFNLPAYTKDFLPNNFLHLEELLKHGNTTHKNKTYFKSVLRLFTNKLKSSSYVNAYAFSDLLEHLPSFLEPQLRINADRAFDSLKDIIYELQYQHFKANFDLFKASPETFLEGLAQEIEDAAELRKLTLILLEVSLGKLIWSPEDAIETWHLTKKIAESLTNLYRTTIITDPEDLNSLYITLLERYCFFLDITGSHMDTTTFDAIKADISNGRVPFLEFEEQEQYIETKLQRFTRCLVEVEAKARAYQHGILV